MRSSIEREYFSCFEIFSINSWVWAVSWNMKNFETSCAKTLVNSFNVKWAKQKNVEMSIFSDLSLLQIKILSAEVKSIFPHRKCDGNTWKYKCHSFVSLPLLLSPPLVQCEAGVVPEEPEYLGVDQGEDEEGQEVLDGEDDDGEGVLHPAAGPHLNTHRVLSKWKRHNLNILKSSKFNILLLLWSNLKYQNWWG